MTKLQIEKLGKILNLAKPSMNTNVDIFMHEMSRKEAKEIMRGIPKSFHRDSKVTDHNRDWMEARCSNVYGLDRLTITVFYPKEKGGENIEDKSTV